MSKKSHVMPFGDRPIIILSIAGYHMLGIRYVSHRERCAAALVSAYHLSSLGGQATHGDRGDNTRCYVRGRSIDDRSTLATLRQ